MSIVLAVLLMAPAAPAPVAKLPTSTPANPSLSRPIDKSELVGLWTYIYAGSPSQLYLRSDGIVEELWAKTVYNGHWLYRDGTLYTTTSDFPLSTITYHVTMQLTRDSKGRAKGALPYYNLQKQ